LFAGSTEHDAVDDQNSGNQQELKKPYRFIGKSMVYQAINQCIFWFLGVSGMADSVPGNSQIKQHIK